MPTELENAERMLRRVIQYAALLHDGSYPEILMANQRRLVRQTFENMPAADELEAWMEQLMSDVELS